MNLYSVIKVLRILAVTAFVAGVVGRAVIRARLVRLDDIHICVSLSSWKDTRDQWLVVYGSTAMLLTGLLLTWLGRWPLLDDLRGKALFALGYWARCRVSDTSHLLVEHAHVGPKIGWLHVGYKGEKFRDIDLLNEARRPLYEYLQHGGRDTTSRYVFTSQRSSHLTEDGIHAWFRRLKHQANHEEWELIADLSFHDLRHDFAHRAREVGWSLEEVAYYLGHVTMKGTPALQTTVRIPR